MMVSTAAFPDAAAIPTPIDPLHLETVGARFVAVRQVNVSADFPTLQDFAAACGGIAPATLPTGYAIDTGSHWSPTFAIYSAESAPTYNCECWIEVEKVR